MISTLICSLRTESQKELDSLHDLRLALTFFFIILSSYLLGEVDRLTATANSSRVISTHIILIAHWYNGITDSQIKHKVGIEINLDHFWCKYFVTTKRAREQGIWMYNNWKWGRGSTNRREMIRFHWCTRSQPEIFVTNIRISLSRGFSLTSHRLPFFS